jgi:hypothetical protein
MLGENFNLKVSSRGAGSVLLFYTVRSLVLCGVSRVEGVGAVTTVVLSGTDGAVGLIITNLGVHTISFAATQREGCYRENQQYLFHG